MFFLADKILNYSESFGFWAGITPGKDTSLPFDGRRIALF
jgi:hypothetical protein